MIELLPSMKRVMVISLDSLSRAIFMITLIAALLTACHKQRYESPNYEVLRSDGSFEIRQYPKSTLISAPMRQPSGNGSFMQLFRFISGNNDRKEKISMTVPVLMSSTDFGTMSFIAPGAVARQGVPKPSDPTITVTTMPEGRYAVFRFKGAIKPARSEAALAKLQSWIASQKLAVAGVPFFAYYNPPWTPGFLRRNEVLVRLAPGHP